MKECQSVRELLVEHALGALRAEDVTRVERHLAWCAGCRKESRELAEGVEAAADLTEPVEPPAGLEDRVVREVSGLAARPPRRSGRAAVLVAAALAIAAMGWGAAMADRAERMGDVAASAREDAVEAAERFARAVEGISGRPVREAVLRPLSGGSGGGRALLYDTEAEGVDSWVLVVAGGLDPDAGPYRARVLGDGSPLRLGRMFPSAEGRHAAHLLFRGEASDYAQVVVVDGEGLPVLLGRLNG